MTLDQTPATDTNDFEQRLAASLEAKADSLAVQEYGVAAVSSAQPVAMHRYRTKYLLACAAAGLFVGLGSLVVVTQRDEAAVEASTQAPPLDEREILIGSPVWRGPLPSDVQIPFGLVWVDPGTTPEEVVRLQEALDASEYVSATRYVNSAEVYAEREAFKLNPDAIEAMDPDDFSGYFIISFIDDLPSGRIRGELLRLAEEFDWPDGFVMQLATD